MALQWNPVPEKRARPLSQSYPGSPMFRLNLNTVSKDQRYTGSPALDLPDAKPTPISSSTLSTSSTSSTSRRRLFNLKFEQLNPMSTLQFIAFTQGVVIFILFLMVAGLLYWSWRLNSNVKYYYYAAEPYIQQAIDHGLSVFKHADHSSASLDHIMTNAESMSSQSIPALMDAVNRTVRMLSLIHI